MSLASTICDLIDMNRGQGVSTFLGEAANAFPEKMTLLVGSQNEKVRLSKLYQKAFIVTLDDLQRYWGKSELCGRILLFDTTFIAEILRGKSLMDLFYKITQSRPVRYVPPSDHGEAVCCTQCNETVDWRDGVPEDVRDRVCDACVRKQWEALRKYFGSVPKNDWSYFR